MDWRKAGQDIMKGSGKNSEVFVDILQRRAFHPMPTERTPNGVWGPDIVAMSEMKRVKRQEQEKFGASEIK